MAFIWTRAVTYEWVQARTPREAPWLGRDVPALRPVGPEDQAYEPLTDAPQMFREFASLPGKSEILDFTTTYGRLGLPSLSDEEPIENADAWWDEISGVFKVVGAWDVLHGEASELLENTILWGVRGPAKNRRRVAAGIVVDGINLARNRHGLFPRLGIADPDALTFGDTYEPATLIGAIWSQTIEAVTGRTDHVRCGNRECPNWVPRLASKRGPKASFCSDLCRARADQRAVAQARVLARQKKSTTAIARATGLSMDRVRRLLAAEKQKRRS